MQGKMMERRCCSSPLRGTPNLAWRFSMRPQCSVPGCTNQALTIAQGWCSTHYYRWRKHGTLEPTPRQRIDPVTRFWAFVDKHGPLLRADLGPCWNWRGATAGWGYGFFWDGTRLVRAHRFSYELHIGPLGAADALHICDNPP